MTSGDYIRISAMVSGTVLPHKDTSPIAHAFQTLTILTTSDSTTKLLAGDLPSIVLQSSASSNLTAVASGFFNLILTTTLHSGFRVTLRNNSTSLAKAMVVDLTAAATSTALVGNDAGFLDTLDLSSGIYIANVANSAGFSSATLSYVATFAQIEAPVTSTNTSGTTNRSLWLGV